MNTFRVVVDKKIDDLNMCQWYFTLEGSVFILDRYYYWIRSSKRHKYNTMIHYNRFDLRTNNIKESEIDVSLEMQEMIKETVHKNLRVAKWEDARAMNKSYEATIKF